MHIIHYVCSFNEIDVDNVFIRSNSINISIALITCWLCPCFIFGFTYRFYIRFYISVKSIRIYNGIIPLILRICYVQKRIATRTETFCSSTWKSYIQCLWMSICISVTLVDGHWYASIGGNIVDTIYLADFNRNYNWGFSANRINFLVFFSKRDCRYLSQLIWLLYMSELNLSWFD